MNGENNLQPIKKSIFKRWWFWVVIVLVALAATTLGVANKFGYFSLSMKFSKPVAAPSVSGIIKGYWSSEGPMAFNELNDVPEMKQVGINTITFSPSLSHDQEGRVKEFPGMETYVKNTINKAHRAGLRVMLETTPMNMGAVNPKVTNPEIFTSDMSKAALKYAQIAEEYHAEYFAPIVEPGHQ
jgi:hypothetical protein